MKPVMAVMVSVAAIGCSSSKSGSDGGGGGSCTVALSGSETATATCGAAFAQMDGSATSDFGAIVSMEPAGFVSIGASFSINGPPMATTYTAADFPKGGANVVTTTGKTYVASVDPLAGTVGSLVITTAIAGADTGSAVGYTIHGTFNAVLAQSGGGSGTVTMMVSF